MSDSFISRGLRGRRRHGDAGTRLPPGQDQPRDVPVVSAGPPPRTPLDAWDVALGGSDPPQRWTWAAVQALPRAPITADMQCVTTWSTFDTQWEGVSVDTLLAFVDAHPAVVIAYCDGGYTTNVPLADVTGGNAWIVDTFAGQPLAPEHGGPARLLMPHLYFWKSAKWVRGLELVDTDHSGFANTAYKRDG